MKSKTKKQIMRLKKKTHRDGEATENIKRDESFRLGWWREEDGSRRQRLERFGVAGLGVAFIDVDGLVIIVGIGCDGALIIALDQLVHAHCLELGNEQYGWFERARERGKGREMKDGWETLPPDPRSVGECHGSRRHWGFGGGRVGFWEGREGFERGPLFSFLSIARIRNCNTTRPPPLYTGGPNLIFMGPRHVL